MRVTIRALSSSGGSYSIDFSDDGGVLRVFCHCPAGELQQVCKHKLALLKGDTKMLYEPTDEKLLKEVLSSKAYPVLKQRLDAYQAELGGVQRDMAKLKEREKKLKADFAYELTHGRKGG
jgi:uncharacterized Zn finger protein